MKIQFKEPIKPNSNPYKADSFHMGLDVGVNAMIMFSEHTHRHQPYIIVIDKRTGERIKVIFSSYTDEEEK